MLTNRLFSLTRSLVIALASLGIAGQAHSAALNVTTPGTPEFDSTCCTLGWEFTINAGTFTVNSLGVYDSGQDGLGAGKSATVAIWLADGTLLVSVVVPTGTSGDLEGFFRYANIAPLVLNTIDTYVIGAFLEDNLASSFNISGDGSAGSVDANVTIVVDRHSLSGDSAFGFPTESDSNPGGVFLGANFRTAAAPEPATLILFGIGFAGLAATRRRRDT